MMFDEGTVTNILLSAALGMLGYLLRRLDILSRMHERCLREFANAADNAQEHNRLWNELDAQNAALAEHGAQIARHGATLEALRGR